MSYHAATLFTGLDQNM